MKNFILFLFCAFCTNWALAEEISHSDRLSSCPIKLGDPSSKVARFYRIDSAPELAYELQTSDGKERVYQYHLSEYGVWVFFDSELQVQSLRFEAPFKGAIGGVLVGSMKADVMRLKGRPSSEINGLPDEEFISEKLARKRRLIELLPDPASKGSVRGAFEAILGIEDEIVPINEAWIYKNGRFFSRFEFGSRSGRVQVILSNHGTEE